MSEIPTYTEYHPRWYRTRVSTYWWMKRRSYLAFILRELSSIFVAYFVVITLLQIHSLSRGSEAYARFEERMRNPLMIVLNAISFLFVLFHTITWFNLAPRAMVVRLRSKRVPEILIAGSNYVAWLVISASVAWFIMR